MREPDRTREFAVLAAAFADLTAHLNTPQLHNRVLDAAGVSLDAALARLLIGIHRRGPIGVVDLADRTGRDHTTVSRQVAKLVELGMVERRASQVDRRVSEAVVTGKGAKLAARLSAAHTSLVLPALDSWSDRDFTEISRLMRRLADDVAKLRATDDAVAG